MGEFRLIGLKEARERKGFAQEQAAGRCGTSHSAYQRWERGVANPPASKVPVIAKALGCTEKELVCGFGREDAERGCDPAPACVVERWEFDELRRRVEEIAKGARRKSVVVDASALAERMGVVDMLGKPLPVGSEIESREGVRDRVDRMEVRKYDAGMASVTLVTTAGRSIPTVDLQALHWRVAGRAAR